jgi:hypothetical protein
LIRRSNSAAGVVESSREADSICGDSVESNPSKPSITAATLFDNGIKHRVSGFNKVVEDAGEASSEVIDAG